MSQAVHGTVLVAYGDHGTVLADDGLRIEARFRRAVGRPCCGDRVVVNFAANDTAVVEELLPRRNRFLRADARSRPQLVAANLDRVLVVIAPKPLPSQDLLDRYLVAVHSLGIEPAIVVNKNELDWPEDAPESMRRLPDYAALGYSIVRTSCKGPPGIDALRELVRRGTSILVGQSGVGKSSLVRGLLPDLEIPVGDLSRVTGKGTHTTTTTTLHPIGNGGLIDSPGVWEYGLWKLEDRDMALGFPEFAPYLGQCRFNDCLHISEPGCAIKVAVEQGRLRPWRYASYQRLLAQNQAL